MEIDARPFPTSLHRCATQKFHQGFNLSHTDHNSQPLYVYMSLPGCLTTVGLLSLRPGNSLTILTMALSVGFTHFVILGGHDPS